jgi:DNA modification methylase
MHVEMRPIYSIHPYDNNPRLNDAAVDAVAASIREFGFRQPIVVDAEGLIVCGHTRYKAALRLGLETVPVHVATDLTPEQIKAYRLADNQTAGLSDWDYDLLPVELAQLKEMDYDLGPIGFSDEELRRLLQPPGESPAEDPGLQMDRAAELRAKWGTAPGQLWLIPSRATPSQAHKLLCGDSTRAEDVARVMGGEKAALCATDPPYLVDYTGERPNDSGKDWSATYREIDIQDASAFFSAVFTNVLDVLAPRAAIYCWHAHKRCGQIQRVWAELGILDHQQVVWVKPTPVFGRVFWHFRHEPCLMGWRQGSTPEHDGNQALSSVWEVDWEGKARVVGNDHPTQKPVELFARPMRKHTRRGDVVFEPFSGSGSQCVAAEQTGRVCYGIDLSPAYVAVALERLSGCGLEPRLEVPPPGTIPVGEPAVVAAGGANE